MILSFNSFASLVSVDEYAQMSPKQQESVVEIYREFFRDYLSKEVEPGEEAISKFHFSLFTEAWASDEYNCFYAGWPSVTKKINANGKSKSVCSSPARSNSNYKKLSEECSSNQLLCHPALFGEKLCVSTATQSLRNSAFSQCEKKFATSGRSLADVAKGLSQVRTVPNAEDMFALVDQVCSVGFQAKTGMCAKLKKRVEDIRSEAKLEPKSSAEDSPAETSISARSETVVTTELPRTVEPNPSGPVVRAPEALRSAAENIISVPRVIAESTSPEIPCEDEVPGAIGPFPRIESGVPLETCSSQKGYEKILKSCSGGPEKYFGSYAFQSRSGHPYLDVESLYGGTGKPSRSIEFFSRNHALNESFISILDAAGGPMSHDVLSYMYILPRKTIPSIEERGDQVHVTLFTGEKVVLDKKTGAILSGALSEGPIDLTTDRFKRQPPNVNYTGAGISIRMSHRFDFPNKAADVVEINQGSQSCKVPRTKFFDGDGKLRTSSDNAFLSAINQACPNKSFKFP